MVGVATLAVILTGAGLAALAWAAQRSVLFPSRGAPGFDARRAVPELEVLPLASSGEAIDAWYLPPQASARGGGQGAAAPALIFAHGNGELIDDWLLDFQTPLEWGVGVLLVEYPGYGRSAGAPSQTSITRTFVEAYDALLARPEVDPRAVVGYGRSLGGAAICQLAARRPLAALVLESTFTGVRPLARRMGVPGWLVRDPFENLPVVASFPGPIQLVHGRRDDLIPFEHALALKQAARDARLLSLPCGHNDCPRPWDTLRTFLEEVGLVKDAERPRPGPLGPP
ncbi:MAG: alpha/beta hydrolase [Myxococcota bacterium]